MRAMTFLSLMGIAIIPFLSTVLLFPQNDCEGKKQQHTEIGERKDIAEELSPKNSVIPIFEQRAKYIRALIHQVTASSCDWSLFIRDGHFRVIQVLKKDDFTGADIWTMRVPDSRAILDLKSCDDVGPKFDITKYVEMAENTKNSYYSMQGDIPTWQDLYDDSGSTVVTDAVKRLGDNVGFLMISYDRKSWVCSGVLLSEGYLLTNFHCGGLSPLTEKQYWGPEIIHDLLMDISWDGDAISREYGGVSYLAGNEKLDYALIKVRRLSSTGPASNLVLAWRDDETDARAKMVQGTKLFMIHHPNGLSKKLSRCEVTSIEIKDTPYAGGAEFGHNCDSDKGSSGAPVFDEHGSLVGLHHTGFKLGDGCEELDKENKAISIARILNDVKSRNPGVYKDVIKGLTETAATMPSR